jgi:hypothetical protein
MVATILVRRIDRKVSLGEVEGAAHRDAGFLPVAFLLVLGPSRPVPRVGARARIAHFGGDFEPGTVLAVHEGGRRVEVQGVEGGESIEFVLSPATARFVAAGSSYGTRLELLADLP